MSGSPPEWAKRNHLEELYAIGCHAVKAYQLRYDGEYVAEGVENTEIHKLVCKILGKDVVLSQGKTESDCGCYPGSAAPCRCKRSET